MKAFAFTDIVEPNWGGVIRILARISVAGTENGGRKEPITTSYRPNHNFGGPDNRSFYIGSVEVPEGVLIHPGETRDLIVGFLNVGEIPELLQVGRTWRIQEGPKLVATAEVLEILTGHNKSEEPIRSPKPGT